MYMKKKGGEERRQRGNKVRGDRDYVSELREEDVKSMRRYYQSGECVNRWIRGIETNLQTSTNWELA